MQSRELIKNIQIRRMREDGSRIRKEKVVGPTGQCGITGAQKVGENTYWQNQRLGDRGMHEKGLMEITVSFTT